MRDFFILLIANASGFYLGWQTRNDFKRNKEKCARDMDVLGDVAARMAGQNSRRRLTAEECDQISRRST